jgi:teichuronic acid biosynthesis glycosyltransferase TuaC
MRVLVLSSVFPNLRDPLFGVFVKERITRIFQHCQVIVVAPIPWFPFGTLIRRSERRNVPAFEMIDGLPVYHPRFLSVPGILKSLDGVFYFISLLPSLVRLRREFAFDLIDAHFVYPDGVGACLAGKWFRCPVTITLRGTIGKLARFALRRRQIQWALSTARRIFCVSRSLQGIALELGCDRQKVRVIPNGVNSVVFRPMEKVAARTRLGLPLERCILLSVGGLCERKGHHRIIEVLPELLMRHPDLLLIVVGGPGPEGDMGPELMRLIKKLEMEPHVYLAGARPHDEIASWLAASDLFCLATRNEGMANVVVEALSCGVPVVTTRVGGNAEVVQDGVNGYLVDFGDSRGLQEAILNALGKDWKREDVLKSMSGRTWSAVAEQIFEEWQQLFLSNSTDNSREHFSAHV